MKAGNFGWEKKYPYEQKLPESYVARCRMHRAFTGMPW